MNKHFVCPECGTTSSVATTCENESCLHHGEPMMLCNCQDGHHAMVLTNPSLSEADETSVSPVIDLDSLQPTK
jgi:transcription elongation factor Elf1